VIHCLAILPDGSLACGTSDGKIIIMDIKSGNKIKTLTEHTVIVTCFAVLPDGPLASGFIEGKIMKKKQEKLM
jgi:WD40 repeat protein